MSERPETLPIAGWRLDDVREIYRLHNAACAEVARSDLPERVIVRRLRLLASMIAATANTVFECDPHQEGMAVADAFWERRLQGWRGDGDDA